MSETTLAVCTVYCDLIDAVRSRIEQLGLTHEQLDGAVGTADRYIGKIIAPKMRQRKTFGPMSLMASGDGRLVCRGESRSRS